MKLRIEAVYTQSNYGYIVGQIVVSDENNKILMNDEDMYWKPEKFWKHVKSLFVENKRFKVEGKPIYHKADQRLEIIVEDLKGAK